jgi:hypothetical protein
MQRLALSLQREKVSAFSIHRYSAAMVKAAP